MIRLRIARWLPSGLPPPSNPPTMPRTRTPLLEVPVRHRLQEREDATEFLQWPMDFAEIEARVLAAQARASRRILWLHGRHD